MPAGPSVNPGPKPSLVVRQQHRPNAPSTRTWEWQNGKMLVPKCQLTGPVLTVGDRCCFVKVGTFRVINSHVQPMHQPANQRRAGSCSTSCSATSAAFGGWAVIIGRGRASGRNARAVGLSDESHGSLILSTAFSGQYPSPHAPRRQEDYLLPWNRRSSRGS
jgi:hypothetical protein